MQEPSTETELAQAKTDEPMPDVEEPSTVNVRKAPEPKHKPKVVHTNTMKVPDPEPNAGEPR